MLSNQIRIYLQQEKMLHYQYFCSDYSALRLVSSTFYIVQILVHSFFDLENSVLFLDATEKLSQTITEMAVELINIHLISVQQKR